MALNDKVRIAVIGSGSMAEKHITAMNANSSCIPVAAVSSRIERARYLGDKYKLPFFRNIDDMLEAEESIDLIDICNRNDQHFQTAYEAIMKGKSVIIEKPACLKSEDLQQLVALSNSHNVRVHCVLQKRYNSNIVEIKNYLSKFRPLFAYSHIVYSRNASYYERKEKSLREYAGGGVLINQAIHELDCLLQIHGEIKHVLGRISNIYHDIPIEDTANLLLEFKSGLIIPFFCTTAPINGSFSYNLLGFDSGVLIYNSNQLEFYENANHAKSLADFSRTIEAASFRTFLGRVARKAAVKKDRNQKPYKTGKFSDVLNEVIALLMGYENTISLTSLQSCVPVHELIFEIYDQHK